MQEVPVLVVARAVAPGAAQNAADTQGVDVVFYTLGDTRSITEQGAVPLQHTKAWRMRAGMLATSKRHRFGVRTVDEAIQKIEGLPPHERIDRIFFLGHGLDKGFFFSGTSRDETEPKVNGRHPQLPPGEFAAEDENTLFFDDPRFTIGHYDHDDNEAPRTDDEKKSMIPGLVSSLDAEEISEDLILWFDRMGSVALDRPEASISVVSTGQSWDVTGEGWDDRQQRVRMMPFRVELSPEGLLVFDETQQASRVRTQRFIDAMMKRMSRRGHVEANFLSCFTGAPADEPGLLTAFAGEFQRRGFKDFSVGGYIHHYETVAESLSGRSWKNVQFRDYVKTLSGAITSPNPGVNRIPKFTRLIGGASISDG